MSYLTFILNRNLWDIWSIFLLGMGRIVPAIALAPFLGGKILPNPIKIGFGAALTLLFLPFLAVHSTSSYSFDILFILLMVKEVIIGFFLGFFISIPFQYVQSAGGLIDHQRGGLKFASDEHVNGVSNIAPWNTL